MNSSCHLHQHRTLPLKSTLPLILWMISNTSMLHQRVFVLFREVFSFSYHGFTPYVSTRSVELFDPRHGQANFANRLSDGSRLVHSLIIFIDVFMLPAPSRLPHKHWLQEIIVYLPSWMSLVSIFCLLNHHELKMINRLPSKSSRRSRRQQIAAPV